MLSAMMMTVVFSDAVGGYDDGSWGDGVGNGNGSGGSDVVLIVVVVMMMNMVIAWMVVVMKMFVK